MKIVVSAGLVAVALASSVPGALAGENKNGMPSRISMNVTVPKQTQGATFGEKVNAGLHAAGSAVAQGAALSLVIECGQEACTVMLPDGSGYRADLQRRRVEVLKSNKMGDPDANAARAIGQGASLLGGAMPGGGIVSAAVSSVGTLKGGGSGASAAGYAATRRMAAPVALPSRGQANGDIDVLEPMADGEYVLTFVVEKATSGLKDTLKTNVRMAAPSRVQIAVGFDVENGVLKTGDAATRNSIGNVLETRHDTVKNSIGNVR